MILKDKIFFSSLKPCSVHNVISFCNQIRNKYAIGKITNRRFPFLYFLKIKPHCISKSFAYFDINMFVTKTTKNVITDLMNTNLGSSFRDIWNLRSHTSSTWTYVSNDNIYYLINLKDISLIRKNIPKFQQNLFSYKRGQYIEEKNKFREIVSPNVYDAQVEYRHDKVKILPIFSNRISKRNKILGDNLKVNLPILSRLFVNSFERLNNYASSYIVYRKPDWVKLESIDSLKQRKTEFIFLNPNKQLDKIRHAIQKQINREQSKEEVVSVRLNKDRNALKSRDFQNIVDQVYKLILKRWQKDLERRGIFYA